MKRINAFVLLLMAGILMFAACQEEHELGTPMTQSELKFSVTQDPAFDNRLFLENKTPGVTPLWEYIVGISHRQLDTVIVPLAGDCWIKYTAFGRSGAVLDSTKVTISNIYEEYFSDPRWELLTNGVNGKTWEVDMSAPIGWAGLDYPGSGADNWNWFPSYAEANWSMTNKDWGSMTFDLNGGFNVLVTQTAVSSNDQQTKKGTFSFDVENDRLKFIKNEMLVGGDYRPDVSNWVDVKILELTETSLRLMVIRDQDRAGQGKCQIMFHFKPKV